MGLSSISDFLLLVSIQLFPRGFQTCADDIRFFCIARSDWDVTIRRVVNTRRGHDEQAHGCYKKVFVGFFFDATFRSTRPFS